MRVICFENFGLICSNKINLIQNELPHIIFRVENFDESGEPNSKISLLNSDLPDQLERPETLSSSLEHESNESNGVSFIDDCATIPPTVILNRNLFVDYKYAYFHHDAEDVQQDSSSFINGNDLEPHILCVGNGCKN